MDNAKSIGVVFTHYDPQQTATQIVSGQHNNVDLNLHAATTLVKQSGTTVVVQLGDNISRIETDYGDLYVVNPPVDHDAITAAYGLCTMLNSKLVNTITTYSLNQDSPDSFSLVKTDHIPMCTAKIETVSTGKIGCIQLELINILINTKADL